MTAIYTIACGIPCCSESQGEQPNWSIALRVSAVVLGAICITAGILILCGAPWFSQWSKAAGWAMLSVGTALTIAGFAIKCVKKVLTQNNEPAGVKVKVAENNFALVSCQGEPLVGITGYQSRRVIDLLQKNSGFQETLIIAGGGHQPGVKAIAVYQLPFILDPVNKKIILNLSQQDAIYNSPIAFVNIDDEQFHTQTLDQTFWQKFWNSKKGASLCIQGCQVRGMEFYDLPNTLFFMSSNNLLVAIGYIDLDDILGCEVSYVLNDDNTISYVPIKKMK